MLVIPSRTKYVLYEHEDFHQYVPDGIPSEITPCYNFPASLVNQNKTPDIKNIDISTNSSGSNYVLNAQEDFDQSSLYEILSKITPCYSFLQVWWVKIKSLLTYRVNELIRQ